MRLNAIGNSSRRPAAFISWFAFGFSYSVAAFGAGLISGYVRSEPSHNPIAGAVVVATWEESSGGFGQGACPWIAASTTDARGRYEIPAPDRTFFQGLYTSYHLQPYKSGYVFSPVSWNKKDPRPLLDMVSAGDSIEGQLNEITQAWSNSQCGRVPIPQAAKLLPFYRALLNDTLRLAGDSRTPRLLRLICSTISEVGQDSQATVEAAMPFEPGFGDPQEKLIYARLEPSCLAIMEPAARPPVRRVMHPNPSATNGALTAPSDPSK
jgi:hypothetical protein